MSDVLRVTQARRGPGDHICWSFRGKSEFVQGARSLVSEGLERRERVAIAGPNPPDVLVDMLAGVAGVEPALASGQLILADDAALPGADPSGDPVREMAVLDAMTRDAVDSGFSGLRMVADVVHRVIDPQRRQSYLGFEHLFDRFCLDHPFTAVCSYDIEVLGPESTALLACLHRTATPEIASFHLGASSNADIALTGSLDGAVVDDLRRALGAVESFLGPSLRVSLSSLEFINHRALLVLDQFGADNGCSVELLDAPVIVERLAGMLALSAVRVVR